MFIFVRHVYRESNRTIDRLAKKMLTALSNNDSVI